MRRKIFATTLGIASACFGLAASRLSAQPVPVQQFDQNQQNRQLQDTLQNQVLTNLTAPELYPGENKDVGPQYILKLNPRPTYFEVLLDSQYGYTDNNRLSHQNQISTAYAINTAQIALAPAPFQCDSGLVAPRFGFRSQWYNYGLDGSGGGEDSLNFESQTFFLSSQYLCHQVWEFDSELDYTRLLSQHNYSQFYTELVPSAGISRTFPLRTDLLLNVGWMIDYHFSSVTAFPGSPHNVNDRLDNTLRALVTWQPVERLFVQPYFTFEETHYPRTAFDDDRNDYFQTVGATVSYYFTRALSARVSASGSFRQSDDPHTTTYEKFDTGIGASFVWRF